jgi:hypothetical protein
VLQSPLKVWQGVFIRKLTTQLDTDSFAIMRVKQIWSYLPLPAKLKLFVSPCFSGCRWHRLRGGGASITAARTSDFTASTMFANEVSDSGIALPPPESPHSTSSSPCFIASSKLFSKFKPLLSTHKPPTSYGTLCWRVTLSPRASLFWVRTYGTAPTSRHRGAPTLAKLCGTVPRSTTIMA